MLMQWYLCAMRSFNMCPTSSEIMVNSLHFIYHIVSTFPIPFFGSFDLSEIGRSLFNKVGTFKHTNGRNPQFQWEWYLCPQYISADIVADSIRFSLSIDAGCPSDLGKCSGCFMIIRWPISWFVINDITYVPVCEPQTSRRNILLLHLEHLLRLLNHSKRFCNASRYRYMW